MTVFVIKTNSVMYQPFLTSSSPGILRSFWTKSLIVLTFTPSNYLSFSCRVFCARQYCLIQFFLLIWALIALFAVLNICILKSWNYWIWAILLVNAFVLYFYGFFMKKTFKTLLANRWHCDLAKSPNTRTCWYKM